ncbi:MAG: hypothetical protein ACI9KN_000330 [Gammaproteobacteria bacterium]|jgi:hypothetical protein
MTDHRRQQAQQVRETASKLANDRQHPSHRSNDDEERYAGANFTMSFTKGLEHNSNNGLIQNANDFKAFRSAIDKGFVDAFTTSVSSASDKARQWEAPTAGWYMTCRAPTHRP